MEFESNLMSQETPNHFELRRLKAIADFQFGKGAGDALFSKNITIEKSRGTKRIRFVFQNKIRICSFRPKDGFLVPSLLGGEILHKNGFGFVVVISSEAEPFVRKGKTVFAKHVIEAAREISSKEEVIIINSNKEYIGIGTAKISGPLMLEMDRGVAVDTRKGVEEKQ